MGHKGRRGKEDWRRRKDGEDRGGRRGRKQKDRRRRGKEGEGASISCTCSVSTADRKTHKNK